MRRTSNVWFASLALALMLAIATGEDDAKKEADKPAVKHPPVYTVAEYDPARKPEEDLAATIKRAKKERKHIILEVGGTW